MIRVGLIGAGNMGSAMARGWGDPVLATDSGSGRAQALVDELGGTVPESNAALAQQADVVILAHKPRQLAQVAAEVAPHAGTVVSVLGGVTLAQLREAYPQSTVVAIEPNTPVEHNAGVIALADDGTPVDGTVIALLERLGTVIRVPEHLLSIAGGVSGVGPAYLALVAEAWVDAAVKNGLPAPLATELLTGTLAGTATLMGRTDTLSIRRGVTSPGGSTARGLAALERHGLRAAFSEAMDAAVGNR